MTWERVARASTARQGVACEASEESRRCDRQRRGMTIGRDGRSAAAVRCTRIRQGSPSGVLVVRRPLTDPFALVLQRGFDPMGATLLLRAPPRSRMRRRAPVPSPGSVPAPGNLSRPVSPGRPPPARVLMCLPGRTSGSASRHAARKRQSGRLLISVALDGRPQVDAEARPRATMTEAIVLGEPHHRSQCVVAPCPDTR